VFEIGKIYLSDNKIKNACQILEEAWHSGKNDSEAGQLLVRAYMLSDKISEAQKVLSVLHSAGEITGEIEFLTGMLAKQSGDIEGASASMYKAIGFDGLSSEFYYTCGNSLLELEKYPEAVTAYEKAIMQAPSVKEPYYNAGVAYIKIKDYRNAILKFEQLLKLEPDSKSSKERLQDYTQRRAMNKWQKSIYMNQIYNKQNDNKIIFKCCRYKKYFEKLIKFWS